MSVKDFDADLVHCDMANDKASFCVYISNTCDPHLDGVLTDWLENEGEVGMAFHFSLPQILDDAIDMRCIHRDKARIELESKPLFDAMRSDLEQMLERIKALEFV